MFFVRRKNFLHFRGDFLWLTKTSFKKFVNIRPMVKFVFKCKFHGGKLNYFLRRVKLKMALTEGLEPTFSAPITIKGLEDLLGYVNFFEIYPTTLDLYPISLHQFSASSTELKVPILNPLESTRKTSGKYGCFLMKRVSIYVFGQIVCDFRYSRTNLKMSIPYSSVKI